MMVISSHNCTIEENATYNSYAFDGGIPSCGVYMEDSDNMTIADNTLGSNSENGITVSLCDDGEITGNTIYDSEFSAIYMVMASSWSISWNIIYDNGALGIYLDGRNSDIQLHHNDIGWSGEFLVYDADSGNDWNITDVGKWYSDANVTGTYTIPSALNIDHDPSMSLYCGIADDLTYEAGTIGNTMDWNSSALNPWKYEVLINGTPHSTIDWDGSDIYADVDGIPVGVYNVSLVVYHISGHWLSNSSILTVIDTEAPTWTPTPADYYQEYGVSLAYDIDAFDPSGIDDWWLTGDSNFTINGNGVMTNTTFLAIGEYELTVHVNDTFGYVTTADFSVFVEDTTAPEWVTTPTDQEIDEGDDFSYQLHATDFSGISLWHVNDTANFAINQDGLITNDVSLTAGVYGLNITISDGQLNVRSATIRITVNAVTATTTTTTTTDTTTDTTTPPLGDFVPMVVLTVGGVGAIIVIAGIVYVVKVKQGG
jgi:parallel beta-helix repeat protein